MQLVAHVSKKEVTLVSNPQLDGLPQFSRLPVQYPLPLLIIIDEKPIHILQHSNQIEPHLEFEQTLLIKTLQIIVSDRTWTKPHLLQPITQGFNWNIVWKVFPKWIGYQRVLNISSYCQYFEEGVFREDVVQILGWEVVE